MPNIFISVINYNGRDDTLSCLRSLNGVRVEGFNLYVLVIDNGSGEIFKADAKEYKNFDLTVLRSGKNLGFSGGHNLGIKYALGKGADYIVILNNDVIADKDLIVNLFKTFGEKTDCGLVSPKIYFAKGHEFHKERYKENELGKVIWYAGGKMDWRNVLASHRGVDEVDRGQFESPEKTEFVSGCCFMAKKEIFQNVGLFDEKYFLYYEDNDLSQRVKKRGLFCYYQPKGLLWHINAGSTGGSGSKLQDYYITRNRLLFGLKYALPRAKFALFRESVKTAISGRMWQKKGVLDFYLGRFGKGSYG